MLIEKNDILDMFCCPQTGHKIIRNGNKLKANSPDVKVEYDIINEYPVLIDFENSVLKKEDIKTFSSVVHRNQYNGLLKILKKIVSPPKHATSDNVSTLFNLLFELNEKPVVLIIGGGTIGQGMDPFYYDERIALISFDIYASPNIQFISDAHSIPLTSSSIDAVIIQAVLEHVLEPVIVVSEIYRVLKDKGIVYAETPFLQHVHEGAYDFTRFTESGHRYLFKNFELIKSGASAGAGTQLLWSLDNFFRGLFRSRSMGKTIKILLFWIQYFDKLIPESYNIDAASGVFFLGRKQINQISSNDIITHYKGAQ